MVTCLTAASLFALQWATCQIASIFSEKLYAFCLEPKKCLVLILEYEKDGVPRKRAGGITLLNQPRGRSLPGYSLLYDTVACERSWPAKIMTTIRMR